VRATYFGCRILQLRIGMTAEKWSFEKGCTAEQLARNMTLHAL
jgi:hypothetical protein